MARLIFEHAGNFRQRPANVASRDFCGWVALEHSFVGRMYSRGRADARPELEDAPLDLTHGGI